MQVSSIVSEEIRCKSVYECVLCLLRPPFQKKTTMYLYSLNRTENIYVVLVTFGNTFTQILPHSMFFPATRLVHFYSVGFCRFGFSFPNSVHLCGRALRITIAPLKSSSLYRLIKFLCSGISQLH